MCRIVSQISTGGCITLEPSGGMTVSWGLLPSSPESFGAASSVRPERKRVLPTLLLETRLSGCDVRAHSPLSQLAKREIVTGSEIGLKPLACLRFPPRLAGKSAFRLSRKIFPALRGVLRWASERVALTKMMGP